MRHFSSVLLLHSDFGLSESLPKRLRPAKPRQAKASPDQQASRDSVGKLLKSGIAGGGKRAAGKLSVDEKNHKLYQDRTDPEYQNLESEIAASVDKLGQDRGKEQQRLGIRRLQEESVTKNAGPSARAGKRFGQRYYGAFSKEAAQAQVDQISSAEPLDQEEQLVGGDDHRAQARGRESEIQGIGGEDAAACPN